MTRSLLQTSTSVRTQHSFSLLVPGNFQAVQVHACSCACTVDVILLYFLNEKCQQTVHITLMSPVQNPSLGSNCGILAIFKLHVFSNYVSRAERYLQRASPDCNSWHLQNAISPTSYRYPFQLGKILQFNTARTWEKSPFLQASLESSVLNIS